MMKNWTLFLLVLLLAACSTGTQSPGAQVAPEGKATALPDLGEAPELTNDVWLNTADPLRLADLRGQVVLLDMWTFG